ncbi:MAG: hypothetical protein A2992_09650 [Elusimicrobia bacterium RIFCSPLOWO2_01_FULL_59_12]|nr:MAG: hypothetical protein A2992_09650 [Elusimicrobia bacterium RIFCSPLOWO2_01_FULL_59_12]
MRAGALAAALGFGCPGTLPAAFLDLNGGARPVGMGGAFSAIADDSNAPLYNPAGIVQVQWNEFSANYANLYSGLTLYAGDDATRLDQSYFAFASRPIRRVGSLALSWANFNSSHLYHEDTLALTYARNLGDFFPVLDNAFALGINLKVLRRSVSLDAFTAGDPVFAGGDSASAQTVDLGFLYKPPQGRLAGLRLALVGKNLTRPDVGFQAVDRVPLEGRLGIAYQSPRKPWLVPALDISRRNGVTGVAGGLESWLFKNTLGLRGGANRDEAAAGLSYFQMLGKRFGLRLDYGFTIPFYVEESGGSHRLALTLYF